MKRPLIILLLTFLIKFSSGQTQSIVGAWHWSDTTKETSIFFDKDGSVSMHSGLIGDIILTKNLRNGKYALKKNVLLITWTDKNAENDKLKFINENSFQISLPDEQNKKLRRNFIFRRVVDEEFIEDKVQSQDGIAFKVQYKPETKYNQTVEQTSQTDIKYSGSEEFLQKIKDKGVQNPTITNKQLKIESVFKTGKLTDGTNFPLTMEFVKTTSSDGKKDIPDGLLIYGHSSIGNMPTLDSIGSNGLDEEFKQTLLQTIQSIFSQLSFPEKRVKVGESFSIESPLSIPIAGVTIEMTITTNYKLLSITNGIADFDVSQVYTMKSTITKYTIEATGRGKGKLLYDVSNNYYLKYQIDSEMEMNMKLDKFDLYLNSKSGFIQSTEISKN